MDQVATYISLMINTVIIPWLIIIERRLSKIEGFLKAVMKYNNSN